MTRAGWAATGSGGKGSAAVAAIAAADGKGLQQTAPGAGQGQQGGAAFRRSGRVQGKEGDAGPGAGEKQPGQVRGGQGGEEDGAGSSAPGKERSGQCPAIRHQRPTPPGTVGGDQLERIFGQGTEPVQGLVGINERRGVHQRLIIRRAGGGLHDVGQIWGAEVAA